MKLEQIEWRGLRDLQPPDLKHVANSDHIRQSILKNGFAFPFAVWQDPAGDIYAIDGHTRKDILQDMYNVPETLPAFFIAADDREDAIRILLEVYNQRHNEINPVVLTEWLEVEAIAVETVNVGSLHSAEVKGAKTEVTEDEYDDTLPDHPETVLGDLYEIGPHRLLCGDSTDSDQVARLMNGDKADIVFTDPPYDLEDLSWTSNVFLFSNGHQFICNSEQRNVDISAKHRDLMTRWYAIDFRQAHLIANNRPMNRVDFVVEFRNSEKTTFNNLNDGFTTLIECAKIHSNKGDTEHKQEKKVELPALFISHFSDKGDIVLDLFVGSGSTVVASDQLGRKCYGIELGPKYCDVIVKRMIKLNPALTIKRNGEDVTDFWKEKAEQP